MVSTLPDLHLKHMGVNLKVVEGLISLAPVSNWPRLNLEGGGARTRRLPQKRGCSSAGRAPDLHSGGRRFDPDQLHHLPARDEIARLFVGLGTDCRRAHGVR